MTKNTPFYEKYLNIGKSALDLAEAPSYFIPSPFGEGAIELLADGGFHCFATGKQGTPEEFIQLLYPEVTQLGARLIVSEDRQLRYQNLCYANDYIDSFRQDKDLYEIGAEKLGLRSSQLQAVPVYMDKRGFRYHMVEEVSPNGTPLAMSSFSAGDPVRSTLGVLRPPSTLTERVWVTENPLIAHFVHKLMGETAMCWPMHRELEIMHLKRLFDGKQVVALHGGLNYTYDQSFYPFFETVRSVVASFSDLNYEMLCGGKHLLQWLHEKGSMDRLKEEAKTSQHLQPITRAHYTRYIRKDDTLDTQFAQTAGRGYFFYGMQDGRVVQSWPLSIDTLEMTELNYRLRFIQPTRFHSSIKLTPDRVLAIGQSVGQLTPRRTFEEIRALVKDYIYMENPEIEVLVSLWIMGTYVYSLFHAYPYLHVTAEFGRGKSTLTKLIEQTSFNGIMSGRITPANLMQTVSDTMGTLCFDEFEKKSAGQSDSFTHILNMGYKKGGNYRRLRGNNTDEMNLYSPKVLTGIDGIKSASLDSRTLKVWLSRKPKFHKLSSWEDSDALLQRRIDGIVNGGYALGLYHHDTMEYLKARIRSQIDLPSGLTIEGRQRELALPLVVLAQLLDLNIQPDDNSIEKELFVALEGLFFPEKQEELQRIKILSNVLREWGQNPDSVIHRIKDETCFISNTMWTETGLLKHFEGKRNDMLDWLKGLSDRMTRENLHIPGVGNQSCIGFPLNLTLNGKMFIEWFRPEPVAEVA